MRKGVSRSHSCTRDMSESEVKVLQKHHPMCLPARQFLGLTEVSQILVIGEKGDRVFGSLKVVSPVVEGMDDSK